jgi:hypothetical protein
MLEAYLVLLIIGLGAIWLGLKIREEVYRIAVVLSGVMLLIVGFVLSPSIVQVGVVLTLLGLHKLYTPQPRF